MLEDKEEKEIEMGREEEKRWKKKTEEGWGWKVEREMKRARRKRS